MVADLKPPPGLRASMIALDGGMLAYWAIAALACIGVLHLPPDVMYQGYGDPVIDAWNWSFAPLDLGFSIMGLVSVAMARRGDPRWRPVAIVSLAFAFCAGLMAISFWSLTGDFAVAWWLPNLLLMAVPGVWLARLAQSGNAG
ncbi:DUF5360 family protein [Sphingomonas sp. 28-63-12]|uniref:DUF5360 family protein n=1 Tax=Sphingomonas sp. 28-63-12 TaxID=1970434 RepID=UPI000BDCC37C|nr:MAG: hypothetical protein B7Y47_01580 [Sphingomonas sp. 28-63-12]